MNRYRKYVITAAFLVTGLMATQARADRIKDVSDIIGARPNQLVGYGIVVGLDGSGDGTNAEFTLQSIAAMLRRLGVRIDHKRIKPKNAAAVIVTADLPAFSRTGQRIDVLVSSLGDAKSLRGGTLIQTPLRGADREVYAVAQGALSVGGFSVGGKGSSKSSGHTTAGRIPSGALVEQEVPTAIARQGIVNIALKTPDPATADRTVTVINEKLEGPYAAAIDPGLIAITIPDTFKERTVNLLAVIGELEVQTDSPARIIINERSGTVVVGSMVQLKPAAIAHGGLTVEISEDTMVSQPGTLAGGDTVVVGQETLTAQNATGDLHLVPQAATVGDLVGALNSLGVKPSDLVTIFQMLRAAGSISAEILVH